MNNKKLRFLTLGTLFAMCGCTAVSSNSNNSINSSSTSLTEYTVTWVVDGETTEEIYFEGETPVYKYSTTKESDEVYTYTFTGWDKEIVPVVEDVTYTAVYEQEYIEYVVTWVVEGVETQETYHYNDVPSYKGETPTKEGDAQYSYTFDGWDKELVAVTQNETYTAQFEQTINEYTVTWVVDGKETQETYMYGEMPVYEGTPTKEGDAQYTYTFTGWDKEIVEVTSDVTYTAQFEDSVNTYTITWVVGGEQITESYEYGVTPEFKGSTDRESAKYTYTFTGWEPAITTVTEDVTYVAKYDEVINKFTVNFYSEDGTQLLYTSEVEYDAVPVFEGEIPTKPSEGDFDFVFAGWENRETGLVYNGELPQVMSSINYYVKYEKQGKPFDISYNLYNLDGSLIRSGTSQLNYHSVYKFEAPEVENMVPMTDYVSGYMEKENAPINIYYSELDQWNGTSVSTSLVGEGTETSPYLISSGADLAYLRDQINNSTPEAPVTFEGKFFKLTKSIDLGNVENFIIGHSYKPDAKNHLNENEQEYISFAGHLDGNHCSIRGVNISTTNEYGGLFNVLLEEGTIEDLAVYGRVDASRYGGSVVGRTLGTLRNIVNYANFTYEGGNAGGGVVGGAFKTATTDGCINYGSVKNTGNNKAAGVIGLGEGTIKNCVNFGSVTANSISGGVIGEAYPTSTVENCINFGNVNGKANSIGGVIGQSNSPVNINLVNYGDVYGSQRVGGVVGNNASSTVEATGLINYGNVSSGAGDAWTGGVWGVLKVGTMTSCVNYGTVSAKGKSVGGVLGCVATNGNVTFNNLVNNGDVSSTKHYVGGIVGSAVTESTGEMHISGCTNNGNITGSYCVGGIVGATAPKGTISDNNVNTGLITATDEGGVYGDIVGRNNFPTE